MKNWERYSWLLITNSKSKEGQGDIIRIKTQNLFKTIRVQVIEFIFVTNRYRNQGGGEGVSVMPLRNFDKFFLTISRETYLQEVILTSFNLFVLF